jgi:hypothetical protein
MKVIKISCSFFSKFFFNFKCNNFGIIFFTSIFLTLNTYASIEEDYQNIVNSIASQFWSEVESKLNLLPLNYIVQDSPSNREFQGLRSSACNLKSDKLETAPVTSIHYSESSNKGGHQLTLNYIGCNQLNVFTEDINVSGKYLGIEDVLNGKRTYFANAQIPKIYHSYIDSFGYSFIDIESEYNQLDIRTRFIALEKVIAEVVVDKVQNKIQIYVYSHNYRYKYPQGGEFQAQFKHNANPVVHQIEYLKSGLKKYSYIGKTQTEQSEKDFNDYFNLVAIFDVKTVMGNLIKVYLESFAKTDSSTGGLVNKRLLNELIALTNRLNSGTPSDLSFVLTQIKSYIQAIEEGSLKIIDNRPE